MEEFVVKHPEKILCAAIWFKDGKTHENQPKNIESGFVICGRRHHNCFTTLAILKGIKTRLEYESNVMGFLTTQDRFVNRNEAAIIAINEGQVTDLGGEKWHSKPVRQLELYSEDLY